MTVNRDFEDLFVELNAAGAEFLVVGAHALAAHGIVRATQDLDVWSGPSRANAERTYRALASFGAPLADLTIEDLEQPGTVFQIGVPPVRIDILTHIDGVEFSEAWNQRITSRFGSQPVHVLSVELLIRNKRASGRPKDLVDISSLEELRAE